THLGSSGSELQARLDRIFAVQHRARERLGERTQHSKAPCGRIRVNSVRARVPRGEILNEQYFERCFRLEAEDVKQCLADLALPCIRKGRDPRLNRDAIDHVDLGVNLVSSKVRAGSLY